MILNELAGRLRQQREKLGLKQLDVANALQLSPQAVSKWERGENAPDISALVPLAKLLDVSTDWLLGYQHSGPNVFEATVLFSDIAGFARESAGMSPTEIADWLNGHFHQVTEAVLRYDGVPIKYIGDAFLCFFAGPDHRRRAVEAALHAKRVVPRDPRFRLSLGLNSGDLYLGAIGHPDYARPDILGDAVNLAARTEMWAGRNTESGVAVTESVVEGLGASVEKGRPQSVELKGRDEPVTLYELLVP